MMVEFADRAAGSILAMAIGDALGAAVEGLSSQRIADLFGQLRDFSQIRTFYDSLHERSDLSSKIIAVHRQRWRLPGLYTDDTQQALLLAESLVADEGANRRGYARRLMQCLEASRSDDLPLGLFRGYGPGFKEIMRRLMSGASPDTVGIDSAGNGAAMRIAPVGLYYAGDTMEAGRAAVEISLLTHRDSRGLLAAASVAMAVSMATRLVTIDSRVEFFKELIKYVETLSQELADHPMLSDPEQTALRAQYIEAMKNLLPHIRDSYGATATVVSSFASQVSNMYLAAESPFCLCSVLMSLWHFLHYRDSLEEAIISAVNSGGDADTIAAMTGAMIGALRGKMAIPGNWLRMLVNRKQVELRAQAIVRKTLDLPEWESFCEMETALTLQEIESRNKIMVIQN
jgi:ADP-ribosylglycohydrolase